MFKFFCKIEQTVDNKLEKTLIKKLAITETQNHSNRMFWNSISKTEILNIIRHIKSKNSKHIYGINMKLIQLSCLNILYPLLYIFNQSFQTGNFPTGMKVAKSAPFSNQEIEHLFKL